nr:GDYXXLXY domain-containing protein [uncultured Gellertiella sp.]
MAVQLTRRRLLVAAGLAAGLQTGVLATMIWSNADILENGTAIRLQTVPVDPRDLLRGDYVVLAYEFSNLPGTLVEGPWPTEAGEATLHVRLGPDAAGLWHPLAASFQPLAAQQGTVVLRSRPFSYTPGKDKPATLRASYGLESYYVAEGTGKAIEEARNNKRVIVEARVLADGTARVASLTVVPAQP